MRSVSPTACPQIVEALQAILAQAHQAIGRDDLLLVARLDSDFHAVPIDHCPNRALRVLAIGVMVAMGDTVRSVLADRGTAVASLVDHGRIVRAFEERDPELAAVIIGHHQVTSYRRSLDALAGGMLADETVTTGSAASPIPVPHRI